MSRIFPEHEPVRATCLTGRTSIPASRCNDSLTVEGLEAATTQCDDANPGMEGVFMAEKLTAGDQFPAIELSIAGGNKVMLPEAINTPFAIVLFYRGHW